MRWLAIALPLLLVLPVGCKRKKEFNGIDRYKLGSTKVSEAPGICMPKDELTWCHNNPPLALGGQNASVDLYFGGTTPQAPLTEILLSISSCDPAALEHWLTENVGEPSSKSDKRRYWRGKHAFIVAQLPAEPRRCEINLVAPDDASRIAELDLEARPANEPPAE